jgi:hypothetical protein
MQKRAVLAAVFMLALLGLRLIAFGLVPTKQKAHEP